MEDKSFAPHRIHPEQLEGKVFHPKFGWIRNNIKCVNCAHDNYLHWVKSDDITGSNFPCQMCPCIRFEPNRGF